MDSGSILHLNKIHRLLRPLRTSLKALTSAIDLKDSRSFSQRQLSQTINSNKGKGKALDQDYNDGSPFGQTKKKKHQVKSTYGASKRGGGGNLSNGSRGGSSSNFLNKVKEVEGMNVKERLLQAGFDIESMSRALLLLKAYTNVLETIYGTEVANDKQTSTGKIPALVEIVSREVGWGIEEAVMSYIAEAEAARNQTSGGSGQENEAGPSQTETKRRKRVIEEAEEDETQLADDWYDAVPEYCRRWIFTQHATAIVVGSLEDYPPILLYLLLEICNRLGAYAEALRYYSPLCYRGLLHPSLSKFTSHNLYHLSISTSPPQSSIFFSALQDTLLSSSFSDRFFYSDFISLAHLPLDSSDGDYVSQLIVMQLEIAGEMLVSIELAEEDDEEVERQGMDRLSDEVIARLLREIQLALPFLLNPQYGPVLVLEPIASALFNLVENFPQVAHVDLAPMSAILELSILSIIRQEDSSSNTVAVDLATHLSRLSYLSSSAHPSDSSSDSNLPSHLLEYLPNLLGFETFTSDHLLSLSLLLHTSSLFELETQILAAVLDDSICFELVKGAQSSMPTSTKELKLHLETLLQQAKQEAQWSREDESRIGDQPAKDEREAGSSSTIKGGDYCGIAAVGRVETRKWKWESMVGSYVVATPSTIARTPAIRRRRQSQSSAPLDSSPVRIINTPSSLAISSLGRSRIRKDGVLGGGVSNLKKIGDLGTPARSKGFVSRKIAKLLWSGREKGRKRQMKHSRDDDGRREKNSSSAEDADLEEEEEEEQVAENRATTQSPSPPFSSTTFSYTRNSESPYNLDRTSAREIEVLDLSIDSDLDTRLLFGDIDSSSDSEEFQMEILAAPLSPSAISEPDDIDFLSNSQIRRNLEVFERKRSTNGGRKKGIKRVKRSVKARREAEGSDDELGM